MSPSLKQVHLGRHLGGSQRQIVLNAVLDRHRRIFERMKQEGGRRTGIHLSLIGERRQKFGVRRVAKQVAPAATMRELSAERNDWISENGKVGPASNLFHRIFAVGIAAIMPRETVLAKCPPAEKPMMPILSAFKFQRLAFAFKVRIAR